MKCPNCQTDNRDSAQFCRVCSHSLSTEIKCPQCGHVNLQDSKFCDKCGHNLAAAQIPTISAIPPTPQPTSFVNNRYKVKKFLGEGGKA
jgi:Double zinc ribbon